MVIHVAIHVVIHVVIHDYLHVYSRWIWKPEEATGAIIDQFDINMSSTRRPHRSDGVAYTSQSNRPGGT